MMVSTSMAECNTILSAYTKYRHLGECCTQPSTYSRKHFNPLSDNKNLDWSKLKQIPGDIFKFI